MESGFLDLVVLLTLFHYTHSLLIYNLALSSLKKNASPIKAKSNIVTSFAKHEHLVATYQGGIDIAAP